MSLNQQHKQLHRAIAHKRNLIPNLYLFTPTLYIASRLNQNNQMSLKQQHKYTEIAIVPYQILILTQRTNH